eukprot:CAMPEP_0175166750 /NCGR_PEP_ID=MMETSP0087-20121206/27900_1 /TAXON_ID=136419 /ORGANISM="Unknown Unknown, Strain D1" /LENGTH=46 /DNA_ID= /DNA_START= /DNA_END= /DNA_ORIENTATION=
MGKVAPEEPAAVSSTLTADDALLKAGPLEMTPPMSRREVTTFALTG